MVGARVQTSKSTLEDGSTRYNTDFIVTDFEFLESKPKDDYVPEYTGPETQNNPSTEPKEEEDPYADFSQEIKPEDLPF